MFPTEIAGIEQPLRGSRASGRRPGSAAVRAPDRAWAGNTGSTAATVDGATRRQAVLAFEVITNHLDEGIAQARAELAPSYDAAATRGEKLTDDELVHYLQRAAAVL